MHNKTRLVVGFSFCLPLTLFCFSGYKRLSHLWLNLSLGNCFYGSFWHLKRKKTKLEKLNEWDGKVVLFIIFYLLPPFYMPYQLKLSCNSLNSLNLESKDTFLDLRTVATANFNFNSFTVECSFTFTFYHVIYFK